MKIEVGYSLNNMNGCRKIEIIDLPDDTREEDIESIVQDIVFEYFDWWWYLKLGDDNR